MNHSSIELEEEDEGKKLNVFFSYINQFMKEEVEPSFGLSRDSIFKRLK